MYANAENIIVEYTQPMSTEQADGHTLTNMPWQKQRYPKRKNPSAMSAAIRAIRCANEREIDHNSYAAQTNRAAILWENDREANRNIPKLALPNCLYDVNKFT